ncbi:relaxase domain-containing protein [Streptomyces puniciscabiei]
MADPHPAAGPRGEETRAVIEAAHERAIAAVLAWIEDEAAILRFGAKGVYQVGPVHGLVAARFRPYEARSGMPLLHDHLLVSVKAQRPHKDKNRQGRASGARCTPWSCTRTRWPPPGSITKS